MSQINVRNLSNENDDGAPDIVGVSTFSATSYFVPPVGNTAERPQNPQGGDLRFNTDTASLEYFRGNTLGWSQIEMTSPILDGGTRAIMMGGHTGPNGPGYTNEIHYYAIDYPSNAIDFGDLTGTRGNGLSAAASRTRAVSFGGYNAGTTMNYVTISSTGDAQSFGSLTAWSEGGGACSNNTRAIHGGGYDRPGTSGDSTPRILNYVTIASTGAGVDYGDLSTDTQYMATFASSTRGFWAGGNVPSPNTALNTIDFSIISTTGNPIDFGDLHKACYIPAAASNSTRAIIALGQTGPAADGTGAPFSNTDMMNYLTMATTGDALDFGDLLVDQSGAQAASSPTRYSIYSGTGGGVLKWYAKTFATLGDVVEFGDTVSGTYGKYGGGGTSNGHGGL